MNKEFFKFNYNINLLDILDILNVSKDDIDFKRWIIGFRDEIIVESPSDFVKDMSKKIESLRVMYPEIKS